MKERGKEERDSLIEAGRLVLARSALFLCPELAVCFLHAENGSSGARSLYQSIYVLVLRIDNKPRKRKRKCPPSPLTHRS